MKKFILTTLFCFMSIFTFPNGIEFGSQGEHIIPLKGSNMSIKKEKITLNLTKDGMLVNVKFVFDNPTAENKIIGFVTPESGMHDYGEEAKPNTKPEPLKIKNFKTIVNGKEVKSNVGLFSKLLLKDVLDNRMIKEYIEEEKSIYNYIYYFNADFKKGVNTVEHSYFYTGSDGYFGNEFSRDFAYVVTTISKWKNKTVEDFEIEVHPGNYFVEIFPFFNKGKEIGWELVGKGKIVTMIPEESTYLKLDNGYIRYKTKNFSPDEDFYMIRVDNIAVLSSHYPREEIQGYKFGDEEYFNILYALFCYLDIEGPLKDLNDQDLDMIRNYLYAFAGYDFPKKELKEYFSQFIWYRPVSKNVKFDRTSNKILKTIDKIKAKRKK